MRYDENDDAPPFLSLGAYSALALGLLLVRVHRSGSPTYLFLVWNLALAWMPWLFARGARALLRRAREAEDRARGGGAELRALGLGLGLLWLLFFPNAPYLITDFVHLRARAPVPLWYDIGLLMAFSGCGLALGLSSLRMAHTELSLHLDRGGRARRLAWLPVIGVCGLSGYGIYLGRFLRFNSWDALLHPLRLARVVLGELSHPQESPRPFLVTLLFGALILSSYLALGNIRPRANVQVSRPPEEKFSRRA